MEQYKPLSVIELPEPTDEQLKGFGTDIHPREHAVASWRLWQIQQLLNDLAISAPRGHRIKLSFKAQAKGPSGETEVLEAMTDYSRWLFSTTGSF